MASTAVSALADNLGVIHLSSTTSKLTALYVLDTSADDSTQCMRFDGLDPALSTNEAIWEAARHYVNEVPTSSESTLLYRIIDGNTISGVLCYTDGFKADIELDVRDRDLVSLVADLRDAPDVHRSNAEIILGRSVEEKLGAGNVRSAFLAYYYATHRDGTFRKDNLPALITIGERLSDTLQRKGATDNGLLIAERVAHLAQQLRDAETIARAYRELGIAAEIAGRLDTALSYYGRGLAALPPRSASDPMLEAKLHQSIGVTVSVLYAHVEVHDYAWLDAESPDRERIRRAIMSLELAENMFRGAPEPWQFEICSVQLARARLMDLLGNHRSSAEAIEALMRSEDWLDEPGLYASAVTYLLTSWAGDRDRESWPPALGQRAMSTYLEVWSDPEAIADQYAIDRSVPCLLLAGDLAFLDGRTRDANNCYVAGWVAQKRVRAGSLLPLPASERMHGARAVDFAARIQLLRIGVPPGKVVSSVSEDQIRAGEPVAALSTDVLDAFHVGDDAKGTYLREELRFAVNSRRRVPFAAMLAARRASEYRSGLLDKRIAVAELERRDEAFDAADIGGEARPDSKRCEVMRLLFDRLPERTAVIAFYCCPMETLVYLVTSPTDAHVIGSIPGTPSLLQEWTSLLRVRLSNHPTVPSYEIGDAVSDPYLQPAVGMMHLLSQVLMHISLNRFDRYVILPHGAWHHIPIHAVLLPMVWNSHLSAGVSYAPSAHTLVELLARGRLPHPLPGYPRSSVLAVPSEGNSARMFRSLSSVIGDAVGVDSSKIYFGAAATPRQATVSFEHDELVHILAHGYANSDSPLQSGLVLSSGQSLPPDDVNVMDWPGMVSSAQIAGMSSVASHLTLQACSLGAVVVGFGDELWGPVRAALQSGVSTVLAPVWDVDAVSSTSLLESFYRLWLEENLPRDLALAEAQRRMHTGPEVSEWAHWYHWAPFQLVGVGV